MDGVDPLLSPGTASGRPAPGTASPRPEPGPAVDVWHQALREHAAWLEGRPEGRRCQLEDLALEALRAPQAALRNAIFFRCSMPAADLHGASLDGTSWSHCDLSLANLSAVECNGALLRKLKLDDACLASASLCGTAAEECSCEELKAPGSRWLEAKIARTGFSRALLPGAAFHQAALLECLFADADLSGALFYRARLQFCRLLRTRAEGARFVNAAVEHCTFSHCRLGGARFGGANLAGAAFDNCSLEGCDFQQARLRGTRFHGSRLEGARFRGAMCLGADFRHADLRGARELTLHQLLQARTDHTTTLPWGAPGPAMRGMR